MAEWFIWPPAQFVNFYFLPTRFRVIYDNGISLGYDMYTSHVKYSNGENGSDIEAADSGSSKTTLQSKHMMAKNLYSDEVQLEEQDLLYC